MNPYFLLLYIFTALYRWLNFSNLLHLAMAFIKNVKLLGSLLLPDPKGTIEHQRGGILKVNYVDSEAKSQDKKSQLHFLLPYSIPALGWTKVYAITIDEYDKKHQKKAIKTNIEKSQKVENVDADLLADIAEAETHQGELTVVSTRPAKVSLKEFERIDVTDFIDSLAGPGKDFFGCPITPQQLNPDFKYLIFHFHRKSKTFAAGDSLANLCGPSGLSGAH
jgi:hypothetical protein